MTKATPVEHPVDDADGETAIGDHGITHPGARPLDGHDSPRDHRAGDHPGEQAAETVGAVGSVEVTDAVSAAGAGAVSVSVVGGDHVPARRRRRVARRAWATGSSESETVPGQASSSRGGPGRSVAGGEDRAAHDTPAGEDVHGRAGRSTGGTSFDGDDGAAAEEASQSAERSDRPNARHRRPAQRLVRRSTMVILAASTALCAVAAVGFGLAWASLQGQQDTQSQVRAVARQFVLDLTNLTPKTVDTQINDLLAASTGQFASQARSFFGDGIRQELEKAQPVEQGQVRALDVESIAGSHATVFAVVDDSYTNSALQSSGQGRQTDVLRLDLGMVDTSGGWKIDSVTVLDGPAGGVLSPPSGSSAGTGSAGSSAGTGS